MAARLPDGKERDRPAEFTATGRVVDLVSEVRATCTQLGNDLAGAELREARLARAIGPNPAR